MNHGIFLLFFFCFNFVVTSCSTFLLDYFFLFIFFFVRWIHNLLKERKQWEERERNKREVHWIRREGLEESSHTWKRGIQDLIEGMRKRGEDEDKKNCNKQKKEKKKKEKPTKQDESGRQGGKCLKITKQMNFFFWESNYKTASNKKFLGGHFFLLVFCYLFL